MKKQICILIFMFCFFSKSIAQTLNTPAVDNSTYEGKVMRKVFLIIVILAYCVIAFGSVSRDETPPKKSGNETGVPFENTELYSNEYRRRLERVWLKSLVSGRSAPRSCLATPVTSPDSHAEAVTRPTTRPPRSTRHRASRTGSGRWVPSSFSVQPA